MDSAGLELKMPFQSVGSAASRTISGTSVTSLESIHVLLKFGDAKSAHFLFDLTEVSALLDCLADFGRLLTGRAVRKDFLKEKSLAECNVFWWVCDRQRFFEMSHREIGPLWSGVVLPLFLPQQDWTDWL